MPRKLEEEKHREFRRAHFYVQKALVNLLKLGAKMSSDHPEVWAKQLAPIYNMEPEQMETILKKLGFNLHAIREMEQETTHLIYDTLGGFHPAQ